MKTVWWTLAVLFGFATLSLLGQGNLFSAIVAGVATFFFAQRINRIQEKQSGGLQNQVDFSANGAGTPAPKSTPNSRDREPTLSTPSASRSQITASEIASRLRGIAIDLEDKTKPFHAALQKIWVTRGTASQSIAGPGVIVLHPGGVHVELINAKTRGKPRVIDKKWSDVIGSTATPGFQDNSIYFRDNTYVEFEPFPDEKAWFSAYWPILNASSNGGHGDFLEEKRRLVAGRLRHIAHIIETRPEDFVESKIDVDAEIYKYLESGDMALEDPQKPSFTFPKVGERVGKWVLRERLGGESGFGVVFKAESSEDPGFFAAVKLMKPDKKVAAGSQEFNKAAKDFEEEATTSMNLNGNPFIVTARDFGHEPWPWIVYPLADGMTVKDAAPVSGQQWWDLAHDLVSGLHFTHRQGIVHRDIKFDNVMMLEDRSVILDFGISHVEGYEFEKQAAAQPRLTSPEMLSVFTRNSTLKNVGPKSDIFGAGLVLYMARGAYPWGKEYSTPDARLAEIKNTPIEFSMFSADETALIKPMLEFDPAMRPTAEQALRLIREHIDIDVKIRLLEDAYKESQSLYEFEDLPGHDVNYSFTMDGPLATWEPLVSAIRQLVDEKRPRYFTISFGANKEAPDFYLQAMHEGGGWLIEGQSELFSDEKQTDKQKASFMRRGWTAPTLDSPNYTFDLPQNGGDIVAGKFLEGIEQCWGYIPSDVKAFHVNAQGENQY